MTRQPSRDIRVPLHKESKARLGNGSSGSRLRAKREAPSTPEDDLVFASGREGAPGALDDHLGGPVASVDALGDVLTLHELGQEATDKRVTSACDPPKQIRSMDWQRRRPEELL